MKLNNRGYMLVEIILASAIAFGMAYFLLNMTIELKNKNDDLLAETLVATDEAIIMNGIMSNLKGSSCVTVRDQLKIDNKKISIGDNTIDIVNEYTTVGELNCVKVDDKVVTVIIPLRVKQMPDKNFDVELYWIEKDD